MNSVKIAPSVFAANLGTLKEQLTELESVQADLLHVDVMDGDFQDALHEHTDGVDLAIESAGNAFTAARVLGLPRKGGEVVYLGIPYADAPVPRNYFECIMRRELSVYGFSAPYLGKERTNAVEYIGSHRIQVSQLISHQLNLSEGPAAFDRILADPAAFGKVMLYPEENR